ncbi:DUF3768 domain-containing protein [Endozoicomonas euniceicola]|uniref:DUF3768 domain-containing protein n=1 Tax=Endozoicomonas euniceicola TaxID=1234143 RepID=A0ABY6GU87_9GAMM|nr:DUF3768 domain-containing protein [Endozoicomonas euniceicola]UYM16260.1 DUF3768 domain-containing protein [Endozoicomonas euniceicola]
MYEIATLNDAVRQSLISLEVKNSLALIQCRYEIMMTAHLQHTIEDKVGLLKAIAEFNHFNEENDPYGEHDFFRFKFEEEWIIARFDYYAPDMEHGSEDTTDLSKTVRILTIMLACDY